MLVSLFYVLHVGYTKNKHTSIMHSSFRKDIDYASELSIKFSSGQNEYLIATASVFVGLRVKFTTSRKYALL